MSSIRASVGLLAFPILALSACGPDAAMVKVGSDAKRTVGRVILVEPGDIACYLTMEDDLGQGFGEMAAFEICEQKARLLGKRVALSYVQATVRSPDCAGVPDCRKTVPKVILGRVRVLE